MKTNIPCGGSHEKGQIQPSALPSALGRAGYYSSAGRIQRSSGSLSTCVVGSFGLAPAMRISSHRFSLYDHISRHISYFGIADDGNETNKILSCDQFPWRCFNPSRG